VDTIGFYNELPDSDEFWSVVVCWFWNNMVIEFFYIASSLSNFCFYFLNIFNRCPEITLIAGC
jgi:hypothetical protein